MAYLSVLEGDKTQDPILLDKERTVFGRDPKADVVFPLNMPGVSRLHARILQVQDQFFIEDLGSRNGTQVNNQRITGRVALKDRDQVRICDTLYRFQVSTPEMTPALSVGQAESAAAEASEDLSHLKTQMIDPGRIFEAQPAEQLRAILDIFTYLSRALDLEQLLPKILDSLFQVFPQADRGQIVMREEQPHNGEMVEQLVLRAAKSNGSSNDTLGRFSRSIIKKCLDTVQAFVSDDASRDKRFGESTSILEFQIRSIMCAPLWTKEDKAVGVIQLETKDPVFSFTERDLKLLVAVAGQASIALQNLEFHRNLMVQEQGKLDMEVARQVQLSFLPRRLPKVPGYQFFAHYQPAREIGGDYFDFIPLSGKRLAVVLGDVAGKGVPAALLMAKLSTDARFILLTEGDLAKAIAALNTQVCRQTGHMEGFATFVVAVLDPETGALTLVNAGHPSPLLLRRNGTEWLEAVPRDANGFPLGVAEGHSYQTVELSLQPGDSLFLFSDGVTDAMNVEGHQIGFQGFSAALEEKERDPKPLSKAILKHVKEHAIGRSQHDDITLVAFGRTAMPGK